MRWADFSAGLWSTEGRDFATPAEALLTATNLDYLVSGGIIGRRGSAKLNSSALTGSVISLWRHYPRTGTPSTLVAADSSGVTFYNASGSSGTFAAVTGGGGLTTALPWYFTNWPSQNKTFLANGTDGLKSYDGSTIASATPLTGVTGVNGPYLTVHKARLWITKQDEINYSVYASDVNAPTSFPAANQLSVNDPRGGKIMGIASFFDFLLILKSTSLWRFVGDISTLTGAQLARYADIGCIAPNATAITPYGVIFVSQNGVFITDGVSPSPVELSQPIRPLFNARASNTNYTTAVGGWYPQRNQYWIKLTPSDPGGYTLTRIEVLSNNPFIGERSRAVWVWAFHSNMPCAAGTNMSVWNGDGDDGRLVIGDSSGFVRTFDTGSDDDGVAYSTIVQTGSRAIDNKGRTGRAYRTKVLHRASVPITVDLFYDQHTSADVSFSLGSTSSVTERWPRVTVPDQSTFGRFLSTKVTATGMGSNFELHTIDQDIRFRNSRVWYDAN